MTVLELLSVAFDDLPARLKLFFYDEPPSVMMIEFDDAGETGASATENLACFDRLAAEPPERLAAFLHACADGLRAKLRGFVESGEDNWVQALGVPSEFLHVALLKADALQTREQFFAAIVDPWGLRARIECDELIDALDARVEGARGLLRDDCDRDLVDALFGLGNDRWGNERSLELLGRVAGDDRRYLAPILVAFLDKTAEEPDFRINAYRVGGKRVGRPLCQDAAFRLLQGWSAVPENAAGYWVDEGAISADLSDG